MFLFKTSFDKLEINDIHHLVNSQIQESQILEYKRELNLQKDSDRKEFLFDVSAMYNTNGGVIIYGIEEEKDNNGENTGKPLKIVSFNVENLDKLFRQIEDIICNSTEPSITQIKLKEFLLDDGVVLVLGVPKRASLPSMVTFKSSNKFYKRRNTGKFLVDTYELNQMFNQNHIIVEKIKDFRRKRIEEVISLENIPNLDVGSSYFIHIVPDNFLESQISDFLIYENYLKEKMKPFSYGENSGWRNMYNIDGFMTFSSSYDISVTSKYNQLFRNGIYEIYSSSEFTKKSSGILAFDGSKLLKSTIKQIEESLKLLKHVNINPPFYISFSFRNVKGKIMGDMGGSIIPEFPKDNIDFPFIQIRSYDVNVRELMKPNFDILYQIFGYSSSPVILES